MKIDTMRRIDRTAGVPLCFLATRLVRLITALARKSPPPPSPEKVLFIELSEMGSAILADPAMRKLQSRTGAEVYFAIFSRNAASLQLLDTVPAGNVFRVRDDNMPALVMDSLRLLLWTRRLDIDTCIDLELFSRYSALLTGLSGASRRVGFDAFHNEGLYRGGMLTHRVAFNPHIHIAKNFIALVNATLAKQKEVPFSKTVIDDGEVRLARAKIPATGVDTVKTRINTLYPSYDPDSQRLVLVNPNTGDLLPQRRWMEDNFVTVIERILHRYPDTLVLITGAAEESRRAQALRDRIRDERCINFCGQVDLTELPSLYAASCLMLTNDSGPGHFSAVTDMPTFVLFGPETPDLYRPLGNTTPIYAGLACSPCVSAWNHRKTPCRDNVCLGIITPEQVFRELRPVLDGASGGETSRAGHSGHRYC